MNPQTWDFNYNIMRPKKAFANWRRGAVQDKEAWEQLWHYELGQSGGEKLWFTGAMQSWGIAVGQGAFSRLSLAYTK